MRARNAETAYTPYSLGPTNVLTYRKLLVAMSYEFCCSGVYFEIFWKDARLKTICSRTKVVFAPELCIFNPVTRLNAHSCEICILIFIWQAEYRIYSVVET